MKKPKDRDRVIKNIAQYVTGSIIRNPDKNDASSPSAKDFLGAMANWAGKGKDELVQVICREIGTATAMVFKEPLSQLLENKQLRITIELVPNESSKKKTSKKKDSSGSESS